jgi:hypothetical protein
MIYNLIILYFLYLNISCYGNFPKNDEEISFRSRSILRDSEIDIEKDGSSFPHYLLKRLAIEEPKENSPLVTITPNKTIEINPILSKNFGILLEMNDLSYAIVKGHDSKSLAYTQKFKEAGWEIKTFSGKNGLRLSHDDTPGFIAYNSRLNIITVVYHGSSNAEDWENNLDAGKSLARDIGLEMPGQVHRGIALKYQTSRANMQEALDTFINSMNSYQKSTLKIFVTGHSQGGSLASLAIGDLVAHYGKKIFGPQFDNKKSNTFFGYFLAPARVYGDERSFDWVNDQVGINNMIRHNVKHDIVPNMGLGRTGEWWLRKVPFIGEELADKYAGYKSVGLLALDKTGDAFNRKSVLKDIDSLEPLQKPTGIFSKIKTSIYSLFAPLHGGSVREDPGAAYDPFIINKDLQKLLEQGIAYKEKSKKINELKGLNYLWARLKHKLS